LLALFSNTIRVGIQLIELAYIPDSQAFRESRSTYTETIRSQSNAQDVAKHSAMKMIVFSTRGHSEAVSGRKEIHWKA
jgi:hypothetical protein